MLLDHGHILNDETFATLICEVESIVNSRPLTVDSLSDPMSPLPLSPAMILTQKTRVFLPPPGNFEKNDIYCRRQWRRTQYLANQFWTRFRSEYLGSLQERRKWSKDRDNLRVGDIVLLKDDLAPRTEWKLARILEVFPDKTGIVRSVNIRIGDRNHKNIVSARATLYHRPVNKLILLQRAETEVQPDEEANDQGRFGQRACH